MFKKRVFLKDLLTKRIALVSISMTPTLLLVVLLTLIGVSAAPNAAGALDTTFVDPDIDSYVHALALQPDGKVLVGGQFTSVSGQTRICAARLNADGSLDASFGDPNASNWVYALALQPDGKVLIGGAFDKMSGQWRYHAARLNTDGTLDNTFGNPNVSTGVNDKVNAFTLQPDGKVLIGGRFTTVSGQLRKSAARLNADGSLDASFGDPNISDYLYALALQPDGKVLIGGWFSSVYTQTRSHVARLNTDGTLDTSFGDAIVNSSVGALALQPDGKVLIGGGFTSVGGQGRNRVARLNTDGTLDTTFGDPNVNGFVWAMALQPDGKVLIGGYFTSVGGQTRLRAARLNADGTLDTTFGDPKLSEWVYAMALQPDWKVLIGGTFASVGEQRRAFAARLMPGIQSYASSPAASSTIDLGEVEIGSPVTTTLTVSNTGDATLNITDIGLSGANPGDFGASPTSFSILEGGAPQTVTISCTPVVTGIITATLTITHNAAGSPATYPLKCTGVEPVYVSSLAAGSAMDLGSVAIGFTVTDTLTVSNTGTGTLNVTDIDLSGANPADFGASPTSFSILESGAPQTVTISCTPVVTGIITATLTVNHNAAGSPATYTLNCTGLLHLIYLPLIAQ